MAPLHCTYCDVWAVKTAWESILSPLKYSQDGAWQRLDWEKFMNCSLTENRLTWMADWRMKHERHIWKTEHQRPQNGCPSLSPLFPLHLTPVAPPLQPSSPSPLSPYVYESVTMATSPQGQGRRGLPSFRQISIAGLIYDGLFRDYNTLMRGQNVCTCTHVWTSECVSMFEPVYMRHLVASCQAYVVKLHCKHFGRENKDKKTCIYLSLLKKYILSFIRF